MTRSTSNAVAAPVKPKLRGVSHEVAFFVFIVLGIILISTASTELHRFAVTVYAVCVTGMFGVSALFHRHTWTPTARRRMRRADHSMIFMAVAGTYTPIALFVLAGTARSVILWMVWAGALGGISMKLLWIDAPKWLTAVIYVALGWAAVGVLPQLLHNGGVAAFVLLISGGLLYTLGAIVYATKKPDPVPTVFGYHEVFHALVIAAALCHFVVVLLVAG